ncbi:MAG: zinc metallopeptidase [Ruminococcus sp.]
MRYFYGIDWTYIVFMLPCFILSMICQIKVKSNFSKYSNVPNMRGMTGAQAAQYVLNQYGVTGVRIEPTSGSLTDHFDPRTNVIRLSQDVYNVASVAAVGVACHEAGHAVQHATGYVPNKIRSAVVPAARIGSNVGWILFLIGLFLPTQYSFILWLGIIFFSLSVLFTVVTLPVEFDASRRALKCIRETNLLNTEEYEGTKKVLQAAAMTYVAAAATALLQLLRLILIANRRD